MLIKGDEFPLGSEIVFCREIIAGFDFGGTEISQIDDGDSGGIGEVTGEERGCGPVISKNTGADQLLETVGPFIESRGMSEKSSDQRCCLRTLREPSDMFTRVRLYQ